MRCSGDASAMTGRAGDEGACPVICSGPGAGFRFLCPIWTSFSNFERYEREDTAVASVVGVPGGGDPAMASVPGYLPGGGRIVHVGANWSGGWVNPLGADYGWMYDDGPGGKQPGLPDGGLTAVLGASGHHPDQVRRSRVLLGRDD